VRCAGAPVRGHSGETRASLAADSARDALTITIGGLLLYGGAAIGGPFRQEDAMIDRYFSAHKTLRRLRSGPSSAYIDGFAAALTYDGYARDRRLSVPPERQSQRAIIDADLAAHHSIASYRRPPCQNDARGGESDSLLILQACVTLSLRPDLSARALRRLLTVVGQQAPEGHRPGSPLGQPRGARCAWPSCDPYTNFSRQG
jgi:hypothetical protein